MRSKIIKKMYELESEYNQIKDDLAVEQASGSLSRLCNARDENLKECILLEEVEAILLEKIEERYPELEEDEYEELKHNMYSLTKEEKINSLSDDEIDDVCLAIKAHIDHINDMNS